MVEFMSSRWAGQCGTLEEYIPGSYEKHSSNKPAGRATPVRDNFAISDQNTPQAFSHFTLDHSGGKEVVVDIQGAEVGNMYIFTDPQVSSP